MKRCNEINLSCISEQENRVISSGLSHHMVLAADTCTEKHISTSATHYTHFDDMKKIWPPNKHRVVFVSPEK